LNLDIPFAIPPPAIHQVTPPSVVAPTTLLSTTPVTDIFIQCPHTLKCSPSSQFHHAH
jgi:hypothetical protein